MSGDPFTFEPSLTSAFKALETTANPPDPHSRPLDNHAPKVVVLGGGKGASLSIRVLLSLGLQVSAVVAMADDGGSTGIIRKEAHVSPPGDVRKCLGAMAADQDAPFTHAFRYRFEFARNHTLGNLMLSALEHETGSFPEAVRICERLLGARGHVYPSTLDNVRLGAVDIDGKMFESQASASHSPRPLKRVWLVAPEGCRPYGEALDAIRNADAVVLGPGSLFTSIIPNLLVPGVVEALRDSRAVSIFACNVSDLDGETKGMHADEHVEALLEHGMSGLLDYAIIHAFAPLQPECDLNRMLSTLPDDAVRPVCISSEGMQRVSDRGIKVITRNLASPQKPEWHDPFTLRSALQEVFEKCLSPRM